MSKPIIKVKGKVQDMNKKIKNKKPISSNFLLTINTNQQYKDDDKDLENDIEVFDNTLKSILNHIDNYVTIPETDKWDDETIKDVKETVAVVEKVVKNVTKPSAKKTEVKSPTEKKPTKKTTTKKK